MSLFSPKKIRFDNYISQTKFLLIWRLCVILAIVFAVLTIIFSFDVSNGMITYLSADIGVIGLLIYLYFTGKYKIVFFTFVYVGTVIIHLDLNLIPDSSHFSNFSWLIVIVLLSFFGLGIKNGFIVISVNLLACFYFIFMSMNLHFESIHATDDLNKVIIAIETSCTLFIIGYLIYLFINMQRFVERKLLVANNELEENNLVILKRNEEKTILVKEIHHRVKNNLQIIISLLKLQGNEIDHDETKMHFNEAINRVMVMSSIHQRLYQAKDITKFNLTSYIEGLAEELKVFFCGDFPIKINVDSNCNDIGLKTVVPIGLLLNELLSNSFKYAFLHKDSGEIAINIEDVKADRFKITYSDDGIWREPLFGNRGFGLELIQILTEQMEGKKRFEVKDSGTYYSFKLNKL